MGDTGVRRSIVQQLSSQFPGVYSKDNVAFVATHSHAGVGGYVENLLPQITSLGYVKQTADAIVAGTVRAVQRAHANLAPGNLRLGNATVLDANINRSPTAYLANPAAERAKYQYDVDKDMTVLRFDDASGNARGLLSFFAVHGTSLYNVSRRISTQTMSNSLLEQHPRERRQQRHGCVLVRELRGAKHDARKHLFCRRFHTMLVHLHFLLCKCGSLFWNPANVGDTSPNT